MSRKAVFPYVTFNKFVDEPLIKRLSLFYDKILIAKNRFNIINAASQEELKGDYKELKYEKAIWDFLLESDIVNTYPSFNKDTHTTEEEKDLQEFFMSTVKNHFDQQENKNLSEEEKGIQSLLNFYLSHDILTRIDTLKFRKTDPLSEYFPALRNYETLNTNSKKSQVIQFILNDIPEPDYSVSWEQIIEYRSDDDVRNKYLALVNWVNKVANSNNKLSEIKDEYDYLYSEYMKQFNLHKMKHTTTKIELILNATVNFIKNITTGNYVSSAKDLFQFNIKNANLLKEEANLPGKEIAYVFHTRYKFENKAGSNIKQH